MKLAVFLPNWVGDVVMATPALRALREHYPDATILGIMRPYVADVVAGTHFFDETHLDQSRGRLGRLYRLTKVLRAERIDLALLFTNSFRTALTAWLGKCQRRVGYARDGRAWLLTDRLIPVKDAQGKYQPSPVVDAYNLLAMKVGTPAPGYQIRLATTLADETAAEVVWRKFDLSIHRPIILLNPGAAYGSAKQWPAHHFSRLARLLVDRMDAQVLVICGPKERDLAQIIVQQADRNDVVSLAAEPLSIGLSKACIRRADLLITTDSGPRHFAAAFNRPVITLFGPTHIAWTETYFEKAMHLQHKVPCGPCQQRVCPLKGEQHHRCMEDLSPETVFVAALQLLNKRAPLVLTGKDRQEQRRAS
jgi:heptosyltransferase-2